MKGIGDGEEYFLVAGDPLSGSATCNAQLVGIKSDGGGFAAGKKMLAKFVLGGINLAVYVTFLMDV